VSKPRSAFDRIAFSMFTLDGASTGTKRAIIR
jgi:hypothetical protein